MFVDITDDIITALRSSLTGVTVKRANELGQPVFPCVIVSELSNTSHSPTTDSGGTKYNQVGFQIEIYTNGIKRESDAKAIRNLVDVLMQDTYRMERTDSTEVPNYADTSLYRYVLRYDCVINELKTIYRG